MLNFSPIDKTTFLNEYWQKKPIVLKQALANYSSPLDVNDIAGLALEEELESRLVTESVDSTSTWQLSLGPFSESALSALPKTHWTLLVQGVDRFIPEVNQLLNEFDFLPQWRLDDIMISIAGLHGSVGPHFDNYDVFLYQAKGQRRWSLTSKDCHPDNALPNTDLRIMARFDTEQTFDLEPGDVLYLPPHIGHHGVATSEKCMTYSIGYRSYQALELWDSFGDHLSEHNAGQAHYQDPNWSSNENAALVPDSAIRQAKACLSQLLNDEKALKRWFTRFASQLDQQAVQLLNEPLAEQATLSLIDFFKTIEQGEPLYRDLNARFAISYEGKDRLQCALNGENIPCDSISHDLVMAVASQRSLDGSLLAQLAQGKHDRQWLYERYIEQTLQFSDEAHRM